MPTKIMYIDEEIRNIVPPTWSSFYQILATKNFDRTVIGYGPIFPESPTKADVVHTSLDYSVALTTKLQ